MKNKLTQLKRQLLLFDIIRYTRCTEYELVVSLIPNMNKKILQRDLKDLEMAGLCSVAYDRSLKGYVKAGACRPVLSKGFEPPVELNQRRKKHINKLHRLGVLMEYLYNNQPPFWDIDEDDNTCYKNCKDSYYELFPNSSVRMMQRDFKTLSEIGFTVSYTPEDRCYKMWEQTGLRESFGIYEKDGEYLINTIEVY